MFESQKQERLERMRQLKGAEQRQKLPALLENLTRVTLAVDALPMPKPFNEYKRKGWLLAWDFINQNVMSQVQQQLHKFQATAQIAANTM